MATKKKSAEPQETTQPQGDGGPTKVGAHNRQGLVDIAQSFRDGQEAPPAEAPAAPAPEQSA